MDGDVARVRTERIYTLPAGGQGGRRSNAERRRPFGFNGESDAEESAEDAANPQEHGSVGHPDDDEAGRHLDITG
jgi:hypothetical protein